MNEQAQLRDRSNGTIVALAPVERDCSVVSAFSAMAYADWPAMSKRKTSTTEVVAEFRKRRTRRDVRVVLPLASRDRICVERQARIHDEGRAGHLWRTRPLRAFDGDETLA